MTTSPTVLSPERRSVAEEDPGNEADEYTWPDERDREHASPEEFAQSRFLWGLFVCMSPRICHVVHETIPLELKIHCRRLSLSSRRISG